MNRRRLGAAVLVIAIGAGGAAAAWHWRLRVTGSVVPRVEPGSLFVGSIPPAASAPSSACSANAERPEGRAFSVGSRNFYVWGPPSDGHAKPIVLAFHGWGSNGRQFQSWFSMERYVEGGAYVVYPDADGANWDYDGEKDIRFTEAILKQLAATFCVDTTHVMALGFSYGGRFVNHLGCRAPNLVRGIVIGGSQWDKGEKECVQPMPVLVVHRTHDATMPIAGGRDAAARWAKVDGCASSAPISNGCLGWSDCKAGAVTFCEDRHYDPEWPSSWNHTMREGYELLAWRWFEQLQ